MFNIKINYKKLLKMEASDKNQKNEISIKSDTNEQAPKASLSNIFIFILFGLASLLGWNAVMSELPFFSFYLSKMDPPTSFPFLNFALNIVLQFLMLYKRNLVPLKFRLFGGLIAGIAIMILLPIIVLFIEKNSTTNVIVTGAIILIMGMVNALCSGGFFALVSFFPINLMIAFSAGQGFSGVMMNIIQIIVLFSVNSGDQQKDLNVTAWIYFGISSGFLAIVLFILLYQFKTDFFKFYLKPLYDRAKRQKEEKEKKIEDNEDNKDEEYIDGEKKKEKPPTSETSEDQKLKLKENKGVNNEQKPNTNDDKSINKKTKEVSFWEMFKILMDLDLLRTYINLISNSLFPKAGVTQSLFHTGKYKVVTILVIYNFMDFFGRYIVLAFKQTKRKTYIISLGRTILVFLLIFNYYCEKDLSVDLTVTSILLIIYTFALGLTHGMGNSLCFGLAPTLVKDDLKLQAGSSMSFFTVFGLFLGSCLAFLTKYILEKIEE